MRRLLPVTVAVCLVWILDIAAAQSGAVFDVVIRHGTVFDGSGGPPYQADVAMAGDTIAAIGDLRDARAPVELDARGLFVAPGFLNIHSHASPAGLSSAVNMLTQGVTTEIINPDGGGGAVDLAGQLAVLTRQGLAVNVGAYIGFNAVWQGVVGTMDRRPSEADLAGMRRLVERGLEQGAWGISAGLDYVPGRYARTDEVVSVLQDARRWRTNFPNHERLTEDTGYSVRAGVSETLAIARAAGLMPVITHVKAGRREKFDASAVTSLMDATTAGGLYTAADVYPYLAGQTFLGRLLLPAWAQAGGRSELLRRLGDPDVRARIVSDTERVLNTRFGGADSIYLSTIRRELADLMRERGVSGGEAIVGLVAQGDRPVIIRFGAEEDLVTFLRHPATSIACDCGAVPAGVPGLHPRFYGTFPRVLGRYVREQQILTWPEAIRKMTALPAATIGMVDRGLIAVGMKADVVVFDPLRIVDRSTYEDPAQASEGIEHVLVNGRLALRARVPTGERSGRALVRDRHMISRPMAMNGARRVFVRSVPANATAPSTATNDTHVELDVRQDASTRRATGVLRLRDARGTVQLEATEFGILQATDRWATFTGRGRESATGREASFLVIVDPDDPWQAGGLMRVLVPGVPEAGIPLARAHVYMGRP